MALYININMNPINHSITNLKIQLLNNIMIYSNKLIQLTELVNSYLI